MRPPSASSPDTLEQVLDETRRRFIATFPSQCDSVRILVDQVGAYGSEGPIAALTQITHRLSGLAGTIGFPTISARAAELENLVHGAEGRTFDGVLAGDVVDAMQEGFTTDLAPEAPRRSPDVLEHLLDETRQRFVATFAAECTSLRILVDEVAASGSKGPVVALSRATHRLIGLAGTIGFPTISARAAELERLIDVVGSDVFDGSRARDVVDAIREAFTKDLASAPVWAPPAQATARPRRSRAEAGTKILVAEDEADQRAIVTTCLEGAGYAPIAVASGDLVVETARAEKPALILLDIAMPGLDGYSACRLLKADPELARIPVIFMTTGANLDDKLAGLMLGADEFLNKPVDMRELVLRIRLLLQRKRPEDSPKADAAAPGLSAGAPGAAAGTGTRTAETPIGEAGNARAEVYHPGHKTVIWSEEPGRPAEVPAARTAVVAEDDPDLTRIIDAQMRAAGYTAIMAFDGEQALATARAHAPDVLVLDLMMPKLNGFEVLTQLRERPGPCPRIIVLSARGREQDVLRAFELGADDYLTKPFNPQELMARIARLLK